MIDHANADRRSREKSGPRMLQGFEWILLQRRVALFFSGTVLLVISVAPDEKTSVFSVMILTGAPRDSSTCENILYSRENILYMGEDMIYDGYSYSGGYLSLCCLCCQSIVL